MVVDGGTEAERNGVELVAFVDRRIAKKNILHRVKIKLSVVGSEKVETSTSQDFKKLMM